MNNIFYSQCLLSINFVNNASFIENPYNIIVHKHNTTADYRAPDQVRKSR